MKASDDVTFVADLDIRITAECSDIHYSIRYVSHRYTLHRVCQ